MRFSQFFHATIPEEFEDKIGSYKYSRGWMPYTDTQIRAFTKDDIVEVSVCCAPDSGDNDIGVNIVEDLLSNFIEYCPNSSVCNLGLFDGKILLELFREYMRKNYT